MRAEVLAPCGNMEMLRPAVFCGADAIYLGLESLNARRFAKGFTPAELCEAVSFCHARNVKVYVAINTILYADELIQAQNAVKSVCEAGADAVIVQDLAMTEIVKGAAPSLPLHASTQMSVHSLAGAVRLRKMGFSRVILSRELSFAEIEHITKNAGLETEVFVHGALCMSISGQCYMSAFLGGRSGNRGSCAGPCRLPFSASEPGLCHLSLKDMSHIKHLQRLAEAGVTSFKIEGRLRKPEYVAAAVNACACSLNGQAYSADDLQGVFSRSGFTDGYILGKRNGDMFGIRTDEDSAAAKKAEPRIRELYRREMPRVGVVFELCIEDSLLILSAHDQNGTCAVMQKPFTPQPAQTDTLSALEKALQKCGGTPFFTVSAEINGGQGVYVPQSTVNELRRDVLNELLQKRGAVKPCEYKPVALPAITRHEHIKKGIIARFESVGQIFDIPREITAIIAPIEEYSAVPEALRAITRLELPRSLFGSAEQRTLELIEKASTLGFAGFNAENLAHFEMLTGQKIMGGFGLNASNPLAANAFRAMGAEILTLSCEITAAQTPFFEGETAALAYGHMPLMITRACPLQNVRSCEGCPKRGTLLDRKNERLTVLCKNDVRTIYNPIPLYMGDKRRELCTDYDILYFTYETRDEAYSVAQDFIAERPFCDSFTRGLYFKGTV